MGLSPRAFPERARPERRPTPSPSRATLRGATTRSGAPAGAGRAGSTRDAAGRPPGPGAVQRAPRTQRSGARQSPRLGVRLLGHVPIQRSRRAPRDGNGSKVTAGARRRPRRGSASPARPVSGAWRWQPEPRRLRGPGGLRAAEGPGQRGPRWPEAPGPETPAGQGHTAPR